MTTPTPKAPRATKATRWLNCLTLVALGLLMSGCPADRRATLAGKIVIKGSNTFGEELGKRLIAEYRQEQPNVTFELESKGTASGFAALLAGECDIAAASRQPDDAEMKAARARGVDFSGDAIGYYGVAVVVNTNNPVGNLSHDQVRDIFTGTIQNWKAVDGPDAPIHIYIRDPVAGTYLGFRELAMQNQAYAATAQTFTNYAGLVEAVTQDVGGIGYSSMGLAEHSGVKAVSIKGVHPSILSVNEGQYPYSRMLRLHTNKAKESIAARDFIRFVQSKRGQEIVYETGFVRRFERRLSSYMMD